MYRNKINVKCQSNRIFRAIYNVIKKYINGTLSGTLIRLKMAL